MSHYQSNTVFNITELGAVSDGRTLCTDAFKKAVDKCRENSGGTIVVPAGTFLTGPIHLISHVTLYIESGAKILFSQNIEDFPVVYSRWEGEESPGYSPLIYGKNLENVTITGRGVLDGQGESWWKLVKDKALKLSRPRFIYFEQSERILIEGIKLMNSPSWTINPVRCDNVTIDKITILNPKDSPNTDGINPDSSSNVHISNCHVDVGDDCITIKSGIEDSEYRIPCKNITITNCTMVHGHGGVVIGSEMSGGVKNVVISNCVFEGTDRGIRIKSRRGRGGVVQDIQVNNIVMNKVMCPFVMNLYYFCGKNGNEKVVWDKNPYPVNDSTPAFKSIHISNVIARDAIAAAGYFYGLPEMPIQDISFSNVTVYMSEDGEPDTPAMMHGIEKMKGHGMFCCHVQDVVFSNVKVVGHIGETFTIKDSENVVLS